MPISVSPKGGLLHQAAVAHLLLPPLPPPAAASAHRPLLQGGREP